MTNEDYSKVPPPHLLKKFSEQAREDSNKRGRPGYHKTFAKLCIDWALNSKSSPNNLQIRSSGIAPPPELVQQWVVNTFHYNLKENLIKAAQWGADQELEACCDWLSDFGPDNPDLPVDLLVARRPNKPSSVKRVALLQLDVISKDLAMHGMGCDLSQIRSALEQLPDNEPSGDSR